MAEHASMGLQKPRAFVLLALMGIDVKKVNSISYFYSNTPTKAQLFQVTENYFNILPIFYYWLLKRE